MQGENDSERGIGLGNRTGDVGIVMHSYAKRLEINVQLPIIILNGFGSACVVTTTRTNSGDSGSSGGGSSDSSGRSSNSGSGSSSVVIVVAVGVVLV